MGRVLLVGLACLVGCSASYEMAPATHPSVPPEDAATAKADSSVVATADDTRPKSPKTPPKPRPAPFPFDELHAKWVAYRKSPRHVHPCDWRDRDSWEPDQKCPDSPGVHAGYIRRKNPSGDGTTTILEISLGTDAFMDDHWVGALLDHANVPLTAWIPIKVLARDASRFEVPLAFETILDLDHVALRAGHDPNPRGEWPQPYP